MLDWAMARPEFKTQLFRFVDVFPALADNDDVARHLAEYFDGMAVPRVLDLGVDVAAHVPFGRVIEARVARRNIMRMAEQFIVGQTANEAVEGLHRLWRSGSAATVDLLGEKTIVGAGGRPVRSPGRRVGARARLGVAVTGRPTTTSNATTSVPSRASTSASSPPRLPPTTSRSPAASGSTRRRRAFARCSASHMSTERSCTSTWSTTTPRTSRCSCFVTCSRSQSIATSRPASSCRRTRSRAGTTCRISSRSRRDAARRSRSAW